MRIYFAFYFALDRGAEGGTGYSIYLTIGYSIGGYGAYSIEIIYLSENEILCINVGGKGVNSITDKTQLGIVARRHNGEDNGGSDRGYIGQKSPNITKFETNNGGTQIFGGIAGTSNYKGEDGSFGKGENCYSNAAGGGGDARYYDRAGGYWNAGGGGSGYIGNLLLINKAMYCYNCSTYARITYIGNSI